MTIPAYAAAGAGATAVSGANAAVAYPTGVSDGHTLWVHTLTLASDTGYSATALLAAGFALVTGADVTFSTTNRSRVYWKRSDGTETGSVNVGAPSAGTVKARMYRSTGSIDSGVQLFSVVATLTGTDASIEMPTVPIRGQAAAFAFVAVADDNALASATGETGGDWTEAVAEYADATDDDGALQLQTSSLVAGPLSGGSQTMAASDPWCVIAFAIRNKRQVKVGTDTVGTDTVDLSFDLADHTLLASQFGDERTVIVVAGVQNADDATAVSSGTYEGVAMTLVEEIIEITDNNILAALWYLDEADLPADGANTPSVAFSGTFTAGTSGARCMQFEGLEQGGPSGFDSDSVAGSATVSNDVTAAIADDLIISVCASDDNVTWTHSDSQDEIADTSVNSTMSYATTMLIAAGTETTYSSVSSGAGEEVKISAWWGIPAIEGSASESIFGATDTGVGTVAISGSASESIFGASDVAVGTVAVSGSASESIFGATDAGVAYREIECVGAESIGGATDVCAGAVEVTGAGLESLFGASDVGAGLLVVSGTGNESIGGATDTGQGAYSEVQEWLHPTYDHRRALALEFLRRRSH